MADESTFTVEVRVVTSTWAHVRPHTGKTKSDFRNDFTVRFNKAAPSTMTILGWEKKHLQTGFIKGMLLSEDHQHEQKLVLVGMHQLNVRHRNLFRNDHKNCEFLLSL